MDRHHDDDEDGWWMDGALRGTYCLFVLDIRRRVAKSDDGTDITAWLAKWCV